MTELKDFNDFLESISIEDAAAIMDDANYKAAEIRKNSPPNDPTRFGDQIGAISYTITLELLGLYHKWLEQDD